MDDLHNPEYWPDVEKAFDYELFERIAVLLPQGMKL